MSLLDRAAQRLLEQLHLRVRPKVASTDQGAQRSLARAGGREFSERREYVPGDDARKIDWKTFARTRTLTVRVFEEERDARIYVLVDVSGSMGRGAPPKLDMARQVAAAFGFLGMKQADRVQAIPFAEKVSMATPAWRRRDDYPALEAFLTKLTADGVTSFGEVARAFVQRHPARGYVVIVSDLMEATDWGASLRALAQHGHQIVVVRVSCAEDSVPNFDGELELHDAETGETLRVTVTETLRKAYAEEIAAHVERARDACRKVDARFVEAPAESSFDQVLRKVLAATVEQR